MTVTNIHQKRHQLRKLRKLRGETAYIDATPARLHLATLLGRGWSLRSIAAAAEVSATTLSRLSRAQRASASPDVIRRILAVHPEGIAETTNRPGAEPFVPRIGTVRRLQALMFMGYSHSDLAVEGIDSRNLLNQQGRWVTRSKHDAVADVYRRLASVPGPTPRSGRAAGRSLAEMERITGINSHRYQQEVAS